MGPKPRRLPLHLLLLGLSWSGAAFADDVVFRGRICKQIMVVGTETTLDDYLLRRLQHRSNFTYGGVDWVAYNKARNPKITSWSGLVSGERLELYTPQIPGVPVNPTAICTGQELRRADLYPKADTYASTDVNKDHNIGLSPEFTPAFPDDVPQAPPSTVVAQQGFEGQRIQKQATAEAARLESPVFASHCGIRYGLPLVSNSVLLPKSRLYNFFSELRMPPLEGLTVFADYVPKVTDQVDDQKFKLGWQRYTLGYALGIDLPRFIQRLDFVPRLGFWHIEAQLPRKAAGGGLEADTFGFDRFSLGIEGAASIRAFLGTSLRLWYGRDVALQVTGGNGGASSQRFGGDFFLPGSSFSVFKKKYEWLALVYLMHDAMFLTDKSAGLGSLLSSSVADPNARGQIYYGLFYVGTGLTVTF